MSTRRAVLQPPPLWARWLLAGIVAAAVIAGVVIAVNRAGPEGATTEAQAEAETNRIADIAIAEDEDPRSSPLAANAAPVPALERAIAADVRHRISSDQLTGPLQHVGCRATGAAVAGRRPYHCIVRSSSITYPFLAIDDERTGRLTWCKVDPPAAGGTGPELAISERCKA